MDRSELLSKAMSWMQARGWRHKLAKRRGYEQSLFEHSLIELDVLIELFPILAGPKHYGLSEAEKKILAVAVLVHDVGKETEAWQAYIRVPKPELWVPHVNPELTRMVVPELCMALGLEDLGTPVQRIMAHCAEFHHSQPGRSDAAIIEAILTGGSDRFLTLAYLVKGLDHLCSAASAPEAEDAVTDDPALGRHLKVARHEVIMRGVSTTFLHRAAQAAFQQRGWKPLLYFSDATLYGTDPNDSPAEPTAEEIRALLKTEIEAAIARDVTPLMVGSPTGNILPKPDLFSFGDSRQYLQNAARKISPQSFAKKPLRARRKVVEDYWKLIGKPGKPADEQVEAEAGRISVAQPEMLVFKFFKAMMDPKKVKEVGKGGAALATRLYEEIFGTGTWRKLQATANLMAAKDMANTVDYFWALPGKAVGQPGVRVAELPDQTRSEVLIDLLAGIAQKVYAAIGRPPSPRDKLSEAMAVAFSRHLLRPTVSGDVQASAQEQLAHYTRSKPFAGKKSAKGIYLCPICNAPFDTDQGIKASADFIDNPQTHTNRGVAYGSFGYIMVCTTCYYECLLRQTLLATRPSQVITLMPRLNFGPGKGAQLVQKVREWVEAANLQAGYSLSFSEQASRNLGERDASAIDPEELLRLFRGPFTPDPKKTRWKEALELLKGEFDDNLDAFNAACGQSPPFSKWETAVDALIGQGIDQQECRAIRREVFLRHPIAKPICQTPNLVFVPLAYEVAAGTDESETSKGLRRLYVALLLSLVFDASVAIHKEGEPVDFQGVAGTAYVPPVPAIRSLVRHNWVPLVEANRWLAAIGAASQLVRDSGLPARSALYQILATDPPEKIARRIEENWKKQGQQRLLSQDHVRWIEIIIGIQREEVRA